MYQPVPAVEFALLTWSQSTSKVLSSSRTTRNCSVRQYVPAGTTKLLTAAVLLHQRTLKY